MGSYLPQLLSLACSFCRVEKRVHSIGVAPVRWRATDEIEDLWERTSEKGATCDTPLTHAGVSRRLRAFARPLRSVTTAHDARVFELCGHGRAANRLTRRS